MCQIKFIHTVIYNQLQSKNRHYYIYTIENQPWKCISVVAATERLEAANGAQKYGTGTHFNFSVKVQNFHTFNF